MSFSAALHIGVLCDVYIVAGGYVFAHVSSRFEERHIYSCTDVLPLSSGRVYFLLLAVYLNFVTFVLRVFPTMLFGLGSISVLSSIIAIYAVGRCGKLQ
jgi:hypothetical protein